MNDLAGKTILITGSTDGLGKMTAAHFAERGATVLLHGRNEKKGRQVIEEIGKRTVSYYNADLSSLDGARLLVEEIAGNHKRLDLLINNAGIGGGPRGDHDGRQLSVDGIELRFQVNYLSHFVLTRGLLPLLKKASPSRVVNVSSIGQAPIDFSDPMLEKNYTSYKAYCQSKLAQIMFTFDLAEELKDTGVTVVALHPATLMNTNMVFEFFGSTMSKVEDGARALEYISVSPETARMTGEYFNAMQLSKANPQAYDKVARKRLRELSFSLAKISPAGQKE